MMAEPTDQTMPRGRRESAVEFMHHIAVEWGEYRAKLRACGWPSSAQPNNEPRGTEPGRGLVLPHCRRDVRQFDAAFRELERGTLDEQHAARRLWLRYDLGRSVTAVAAAFGETKGQARHRIESALLVLRERW